MTLVDRSLRRRFTTAMALAMALALLMSGAAFAAVDIDSACADAPDADFPDIEGNTHEEAINCIAWYEVTQGTSDGDYEPAKRVPRWQMALFIHRTAEYMDPFVDADLPTADGDHPFTDVDAIGDDEAKEAIEVLYEIDVVQGTTATTYDPNTNIKRDQMASFINRLQEWATGSAHGASSSDTSAAAFGFPDVDADNVHGPNIQALKDAEIVEGFGDGTYGPRLAVRRDQMGSYLGRNLAVNVNEGHIEPKTGPAGPLGDLTDAPELQTVEIANTDEGANKALLKFSFDETLLGGGDPAAAEFHVVAPDGDVDAANSAARDGDDLNVINAVFDLDLVERATAAAVSTAAVTDVDDGLDNPEADFPLQSLDIAAGDSAFPDLVSVENFDATDNTVDFVFDEDVQAVDALGLLVGDFNLIPVDGGAPVPSALDAIPDIEGGTVTVPFADITSTTEADTARGDVVEDTVEDTLDNDGNLDRTADVSNDGNTDDNPDLESFTIDVENDEATFTFDVDIAAASVDPGSFYLQDLNGDTVQGQTDEGTSGKQVTVGFNDDEVSDAPVAAFVEAGAVDANAGGAPSNEADSATRSLSFDAGDTLAPNLVSAEVTETKNVSGDVTAVNLAYTFDDDVDATAVTANAFVAYEADGTSFEVDADAADTCDVSAEDDTVVECVVTSDLELLDDAVLATIENNAVADIYGFESHPENAPID